MDMGSECDEKRSKRKAEGEILHFNEEMLALTHNLKPIVTKRSKISVSSSCSENFAENSSQDLGGNSIQQVAEEQESEMRTPTSEENKIGRVLECPPAPRKKRHSSRPSWQENMKKRPMNMISVDDLDSFFGFCTSVPPTKKKSQWGKRVQVEIGFDANKCHELLR